MRVGERGILVTTAEAARLYGCPLSTLRRLAFEDGWRPFGSGHRRYWHLDQVEASLEKRNRLSRTA